MANTTASIEIPTKTICASYAAESFDRVDILDINAQRVEYALLEGAAALLAIYSAENTPLCVPRRVQSDLPPWAPRPVRCGVHASTVTTLI
jgi:hypothetical protein